MDYYRLADLSLTVADDFDDACREPVYQMMLGCRPADHEALLRGTSGVKIAVSWERAADVIPVSSGKGTSIAKILGYFNLEPAQAMAFEYRWRDLLPGIGLRFCCYHGFLRILLFRHDIRP